MTQTAETIDQRLGWMKRILRESEEEGMRRASE